MFYFAYGSNLNKKQMAKRCPQSKAAFTATLIDFKVIFTGFSKKWGGGVATIKPSNGDKVEGAVYDISAEDLENLDGCEGFNKNPKVYDRDNFQVLDAKGNQISVITYFKPGQTNETPPSKKYFAVINNGYRDWGIQPS